MKKVSILTPCYNGAAFIKRYMDMIMAQQVLNMELIFVDDGSTDDTAAIVKGYKDILAQHDIELHYMYCYHQGIAGAINTGLPYVTGEYLIYPDIDDILLPGSISKRVKFLDSHGDYDVVGTRGWDVLNSDLKPMKDADFSQEEEVENLVTALIENGWNTFTCSYMLRTSKLFAAIPNKKIYANRGCTQQDVQLLLLAAYNSRCGFLQEYLYKRVVRADSDSNIKKTYLEYAVRFEALEDVFCTVLRQLAVPEEKYKYYKKCLHDRYHGQIKALMLNYLFTYEPEIMKKKLEAMLQGRKLALFGTGRDGQDAIKAVLSARVNVDVLIDNSNVKQGTELMGVKIVSIDEILSDKEQYFIAVTTDRYKKEISSQLDELGFIRNKDYCTYNNLIKLI